MKYYFVILVGLLICSADLGAVVNDYAGQPGISEPIAYVEGVLIVTFDQQVEPTAFKKTGNNFFTGLFEVDKAFTRNNVQKLEKLFETAVEPSKNENKPDLSRVYRIEFAPEIDLGEFISELESQYGIKKVEPVGIHQIAVTPNDNNFGTQWHHNSGSDHDIDSPEAWDVESGDSSVVVAIVDTGVQWDHPDLGGGSPYINGNIWINWDEYNGADGVDDDGNGYIDDYRGWDWVSVSGAWSGEDAATPDNNPMDFNGHGTHCAGIAAAITNNGLGVAGVAGGFYPTQRGVKIMSLRVGWSAPHPDFGYETGYVRMDFCAQAFYYAADNGADVISCSWSSSNSGGIGAALNYAVANDVVICKAAGNESHSYPDYLCGQSTVVSVASTTSGDSKSGFSNYGTWVDISAPGSGIYSTYSNHGSATFASLSGTSMACPMAAGLAALIKSRDTNLDKTDIENIMFNSADNIDDENPGYIGMLGAGRINSFNAVTQLVYSTLGASPRMGLPPLDVEFAGGSPFDVESWKYYFGDGDSSDVEDPIHTYTEPGAYTVTQEIVTTLGGSIQILDSFIFVLADTISPYDFQGPPETTDIEVSIRVNNIAPINEMIIPLTFAGELDLSYVGFSVEGTRSEYFERANLLVYNNLYDGLVFRLLANDGGGSPPLGAGDGDVLRLFFNLNSPGEGVTAIDTLTLSNYSLEFSTYLGDYVPWYVSSQIMITNDQRGDANGDESVNVSDAVYIINYVFIDGSPGPVSDCGGDANNDSDINVSDAVFIINYVFIDGSPEPDPCF
jgi:subtilisin family serine protease